MPTRLTIYLKKLGWGCKNARKMISVEDKLRWDLEPNRKRKSEALG